MLGEVAFDQGVFVCVQAGRKMLTRKQLAE
jgi:hypothetical protein